MEAINGDDAICLGVTRDCFVADLDLLMLTLLAILKQKMLLD